MSERDLERVSPLGDLLQGQSSLSSPGEPPGDQIKRSHT